MVKADLQMILQSPCFERLFQDYKLEPFKRCTPGWFGSNVVCSDKKVSESFWLLFFPGLRIIQTELTCNGFCRENSESFIPKAMAIGFQNFAQNTLCKKWRNISNRVMLIIFKRESDLGKGQEGASRLESTDICLI